MRCAALFILLLASSHVAHAQEDISRYQIEVSIGPLIAPANIVGMGGASIAIAEGASFVQFNPAAIANRYAYNGEMYWDWDWALDWLNVGAGALHADTLRDGLPISKEESVSIATVALSFVIGEWGLGIAGSFQSHDFCRSGEQGACEAAQRIVLEGNRGGFATGFHLFNGELVLGAQLGASSLTINTDEGASGVEFSRLALGLGALWRPHALPLRVGLSLALPALFSPDVKNIDHPSISPPAGVTSPWELGLGFAYRWGARPFNPEHTFDDPPPAPTEPEALLAAALPDMSDPESLDRRYILAALDLVMLGPSTDAIGVRAWLNETLQRAGVDPSLSVRLGVESEFWSHRMRGRVGSYWEPSRYAGVSGRLHGTAGLDLRLFELIWDWRFTTAVDVTQGYFNYMLSIGFWH